MKKAFLPLVLFVLLVPALAFSQTRPHDVSGRAVRGTETVTSPLAAAGWTLGTDGTGGWGIAAGVLSKTASAGTQVALAVTGQTAPVVGTTYEAIIVSSAVSGTVTVSLGGVTLGTITAAGTSTLVCPKALSTAKLSLSGPAATTCTITSISVKPYVDGTGDVTIEGNQILKSPVLGPDGTEIIVPNPGAVQVGAWTDNGTTVSAGRAVVIGTSPPGTLQTGQIWGDGSQLNNYSKLRKHRAALSSAVRGISTEKILFVGDSTTFGFYSNNSPVGDWKTGSIPNLVARILSARGISAQSENWFGYHQIANDTRIVLSSNWGQAGLHSINQDLLVATNNGGTNNGDFSFTPATQVDTFIVYYVQNTTLGHLSINVNGGAPTDVNAGGASAIQSTIITTALGSNTVNIRWASGGAVYLIGVDAYNSALCPVRLLNAGWGGSGSTEWNSYPSFYGCLSVIQALAPNLTLICLGINDWITPINLVAYTANIQAVITAALASGDVILVTPTPSETGSAALSVQATYVSALYSLAQTNGLLLIDLWSRWTSYAVSQPLGLYYDTLHPSGAGYQDQALVEAGYIMGDR